MITNIFLGLILGVVITSFIILNNKINRIEFNTKFIIDVLKNIDNYADSNNTNINHLLDRFNKRILVNEEYFNIIKNLIEKNKIEIYNNQEILYNLPVKLETFITEENNSIRKELKKLAKISSKINSKRKQSNNTQK